METLRYKGFVGSIEAELKDNTLYGKVLGLDAKTMITYEGSTLSELKKDFQNGVDDYIAHCKEHNIPLHKSYSGNFQYPNPLRFARQNSGDCPKRRVVTERIHKRHSVKSRDVSICKQDKNRS